MDPALSPAPPAAAIPFDRRRELPRCASLTAWLLALLALFVGAFAATGVSAAPRPNILWLSCEDISAHLGCYGDPYAVTPHLDALAEKGTRFSRVFTTAGVCAPCRSGIITGMYQNSIGTHHMRCDATLPDWLRPFPLFLREAGYYCTNHTKTDYQFSEPSPREIWDESSRHAHWRNREEGQPFFAVFNFVGCHESGIARDDRYTQVTSVLSEDQRQDPAAFDNLPPYYPDTPVVREDWKRNYELITAMDAWAGEMIEELKAAGEWENTIVVFWSDHGIGLPRAKRWLYDSGTHVPFIMHVPEAFRDLAPLEPGTVDGRLVSSVDFGPTMLHLAGVERPEWMQGVSFLDPETPRSHVFGARDRMDERYDIIRAVRDERFRYIRNFEPLKPYYQYMNTPERGATMQEIRRAEEADELTGAMALFSAEHKPVEELYDLENDPHEIHNLADDPAHADRKAELQQALRDWQLRIRDLGLIPESEIAVREQAAGSAFDILHGREDGAAFIEDLASVAAAASEGPEAFPALREALDHDDAAVRYWGATGFGNFAEALAEAEGAEAALRKRLSDESAAVRIAAGRALLRANQNEEALRIVADELEADIVWTRLKAAIVLDELEEGARPVVADLKTVLEAGGDRYQGYVVRVVNKALNDLLGTENQVP